MARIYSASRVVFNRSIKDDVNMRVFEAVACGSLLLSNDLTENGQAEFFQDGMHHVTYRDSVGLLQKIADYLAHPYQRERIAAAGRAEALAEHTYRHRMERMLAEAAALLSRGMIATGAQRASSERARERDEQSRTETGPMPQPPAIPGPRSAVRHTECACYNGLVIRGLTSVIIPCWNQARIHQAVHQVGAEIHTA
jgi:hypothetical protein